MLKHISILVLLLIAVSGQTTCSVSALSNIASNTITMVAGSNGSIQKEYTETIGSSLGMSAVIHTAFAIAGFQGSCTQPYFALGVDQVILQNSNTKMRFSMNYVYNDNTTTYTSQWTRVKVNYLLVSDRFSSYPSPIEANFVWAGSVQFTPQTKTEVGLWGIGSIFANSSITINNGCGYLRAAASTSTAKFDYICNGSDRIVPHFYIMGFQFSPSSVTLGAMAKVSKYLTTFGTQDRFGTGPAAIGWGPFAQTSYFGGSLKKVKVAVVLTTITDLANYPTNNNQGFSYSGIYMLIDMENIYRPVVQSATGYNRERFNIAKLTYGIYGLSSFTLNAASNCNVIDIDVNVTDINNAIVRTDNTDSLTDVIIAGDFYSGMNVGVCGSGTPGTPSREMTSITSKLYKTVPDLAVGSQDIKLTQSTKPTTFQLTGSSLTNGSTTITYNITMKYEGFLSGYTYRVQLSLKSFAGYDWRAVSFANVPIKYIKWITTIDGKTILDVNLTDSTSSTPNLIDSTIADIGIAIKSTTPVIQFIITIPRPQFAPADSITVVDFKSTLTVQIDEFLTVYNPISDCCDSKCPEGSGINIKSVPPSCTVCVGQQNLSFDYSSGICTCKTGYYDAASTFSPPGALICFPCLGKLCGTCAKENITRCTTCIAGAQLDINNICQCGSEFFQSNGVCQSCPAKCSGCQVNGVCAACNIQEPLRKIQQNCDCPANFYDDGTYACKSCNPLCKTCTNSSACTTCYTQSNRNLVNGQCVCSSGYYQVVNADNTITCKKCSSECKECSGPTVCLNCQASENRIIGYDENGHQTCYCSPGFSASKNGPCVQNGCTADPYCQVCDDARGVTVCVQCIASTNRLLVLPQYQCLCKQGFYDENGICKPCSSGCAKCSNATVCERCAVSATNNNNGSCACPQSYYFVVQPLRYCKRCKTYCLKCQAENTCDLCLPGFSATSNGECICARGKYVNANLQCVACINNCTVCASETNCSLCNTGYFLQDSKCVTRCNIGYYISGVVCEKCQDGCSHCQRAGTCLVCEAGRYSYNGLCYVNCPSGSIAEPTNMTCLSCNSPCGNCTQHPSKCLNCLSGNFFEFGCVDSCPTGTYSLNKICTYCSFECAACLGTASTCIACPDQQYLFEGKCYAKCPIALVNGKCPNLCPTGYFTQAGSGNCLKCNDKCKSCDGAADKCTSCASGFANNGVCVTACPTNTLNVAGNCLACSEGCNGCKNTVDQCSACQSGYFSSGTKCIAACDAGYFRDGNNGCKACPDTCKSCSSATTCTTCVETRNQPINGVCYSCIYPCSACTSYEQCTACLSGFSVVNGRCTSQCPAGSTAVNGACKCASGAFQSGQCVSACSAGWTNIDGTCQQCNSNCGECSGKTTTCTSCKTGYLLNGVSGTCDVNKNCQFGEYFSSEINLCKRICPTGYSYQDSLCVSQCLSGFKDNGFGGCVEQGVVSGCSYPYFYQQGSCVSTCNAGTYPNSATRVCQACGSNCFSCMSSAFCTNCNSGYDLNSNICLTGQRCANNKLKYNGVCLDSCPVGTIASNGYCERRCDPDTYFLDSKCYAQCPSGYAYRTDVACVVQCDSGYILSGSVCKLSVQTCPSGQFYNAQNGVCTACTYPCSQCQYTSSYCSACPSGFTLTSNKCSQANSCGTGKYRASSGSCSTCPAKCLDCVSATQCATCASGYVFNGVDCVVKVSNLKEIQITQNALSRRNNTVFISVKLSIIPNGLSNDQLNGFFIVVASSSDKINKVNQWVSTSDANTVIIAVDYATFPATTSTLFVSLNAALLATSLANVGYTASENSFLSVVISNSIATAPTTLIIPSSATNSIVQPATSLGFKSRTNAKRTLGETLA